MAGSEKHHCPSAPQPFEPPEANLCHDEASPVKSERRFSEPTGFPTIGLLPIELLEEVIWLAVNDHYLGGSKISWVCMWRRVSRKWKIVIDGCPSLWSSIVIDDTTDSEQVEPQLKKSKGAPLDIQIFSIIPPSSDEDWIQLLVDNVHRWRSVVFNGYFKEIVARLESSPLKLDALKIKFANIPHDSKLLNLITPNLRKLYLDTVTIPHNFNSAFGLEELRLYDICERWEDGTNGPLSISKLHQFLHSNPNLRILRHEGGADADIDPNDRGLQSVDLPKLDEVTISSSQILHLFRAEQCVQVSFTLRSVEEKPPRSAWATFVHALKRVERLVITVGYGSLSIAAEPCAVELFLENINAINGDSGNLVSSILEDILDEAESNMPTSACVELAFFTTNESGSNLDVSLEVLKLLQTPVSDSSSGQARWRIPNLDTIRMSDPGLPYQRLRAFVQARSNGHCVQPPSPITGIFIRSHEFDDECQENVLDKVMVHTTGGNDR